MSENKHNSSDDISDDKKAQLRQRLRLFSTLYRVVILVGLVFVVVVMTVSLLTLRFYLPLSIAALAVLIVGIILARIEYVYYQQLFSDQPDEKKPAQAD